MPEPTPSMSGLALSRPSDDAIWSAVSALRLATADLLETLTEAELATPSLCAGWRVRDVAAHVSLQGLGLRDFLTLAVKYYRGGGTNTLIRRSAQLKAAQVPLPQILAELRALAATRRPNFGLSAMEALTDILAHSQDIALPLGRTLAVEPRVAAWAATGSWLFRRRDRFGVVGAPPLTGVTLTATDVDWSMGDGPVVRGPMLALFMVVVGRTATLAQLDGVPVQPV
ncbi:maleylpyruvate isomerase family mycothiol-dependent enzyme [Granulicoccus phenolivorans]|uniref:maleylpyruvate isomerase family mycothiol-dependent enzyme n=1 Tax=Granulicoccus phenolivorans TaxID=266854 RepID=UPI000425A72C|nr:maleylpyruvate isomerase family mycothiol-dependent enzyme [Granulicoccus phenolivorans]